MPAPDAMCVNGRRLADWIPDVVARLTEDFDPLQVVVFGSVARGDDGPHSDIDLLVVLPEIVGRRHDVAVELLRAVRDVPVAVDVYPTDPSDVERRGELPGVLRRVRALRVAEW